MPVLIANNASSRLAGSITDVSTELAVSAGDGAKFPMPTAGQWFPLTLIKDSGVFEIMRVTARSGDLLTVSRGAEGTQPTPFSVGDRVELRMTADAFNQKMDKEGGTFTGSVTLTADLTTYRPSAPSTGYAFLGNSGTKYIGFDGTNYVMPGGQLYVNGGQVWHSGNFNPASYMPLTGANFSGNFGIYNTSPTIMFYDTDWGPRQLHSNGGLIGFLTSGGGWAVYSDNSGNLIASANVAAFSDRKHKKHIKPIRGALALIEKLRGVRYVRKRDGQHCVGVIAQEVREVLPEVVLETPDGLSVDYGNLVAPLIGAVQELAARVRKLEG